MQRLEAHEVVEDFMLLANETIARLGAAGEHGFLYRVHEPPEEAELGKLRELAAMLGYRLAAGTPRDLQRLLRAAAGRTEEALVATAVLRSLKQARYSEAGAGHFGLAVSHYTHFTSPIRRYPDLMVHRLIGSLLLGGRPTASGSAALAEIAREASERERAAMAAERDSVDLKKVEFMRRHLGDEFAGTIASVRAFGFFVLLDAYFVEGLVHVSSLEDDYYLLVEDEYALVGEHGGRRFRLGDRVRVRVAAVDTEERQIDFVLAGSAQGPRGRGGRSSRKRP